MKKRRILFLLINLTAAAGIALSGYMTWLGRYAPQSIGIGEILPFELHSQTLNLYISVLSPILAGAVFIGIGGLLLVRSMVWFGLLISSIVAGFWLWRFGFSIDSISINDGFSLFAASLLLAILSLFLHKHQRRHSREKHGGR